MHIYRFTEWACGERRVMGVGVDVGVGVGDLSGCVNGTLHTTSR